MMNGEMFGVGVGAGKGIGGALKGGVRVAAKAIVAATGAVTAFTGASVKAGMSFDAEMSKVQAISGADAEAMMQLRDKAEEMGASTKFTATEAAEALTYMGMAGWKSDQMLEGLPGIMNLAAAAGENLGTTSDIVTDALTAFGMQAEESGHFADILAAAATNSNTTVSMLGESFKYAAPVVGAMFGEVESGAEIAETTAAALGVMANSGIKASQGGTALRAIFSRMAKPTKDVSSAMDELGIRLQDDTGRAYTMMEVIEQLREGFTDGLMISSDELRDSLADLSAQFEAGELTEDDYAAATERLMERAYGASGVLKAQAAAALAGRPAMAGLLALVNSSEEDFNQLTNAIAESSETMVKTADGSVMTLNKAMENGLEIIEEYDGAASAMAATMQDNLAGDVVSFKSALEGLQIAISDRITPTLRDFVQFGRDGLRSLTTAFQENGIDGAIEAFGSIIEGGVGLIFEKLPIMIQAGVKVLEALVNGIITNLPALIPAVVQIFTTLLQNFTANLPMLVDAAVQIVFALTDGLIDSLPVLIPAIVQMILTIVEKLTEPSTLMQLIQAAFQIIGAVAQGLINAIPELVKAVPTIMLNLIEAILRFLPQVLASGIQLMTELALGIARGGVEVLAAIGKLLVEIPKKFKERAEDAKNWGKDLIQNFLDGIKEKWGDLKKAVSDTAQKIKDFLGFSKPKEGPLSDADKYGGDFIELFIKGMDGKKNNLLNDIKTIASNIKTSWTTAWDNINQLTGSKLDNLKAKITTTFDRAKEAVKNAVDRFKSLMKFNWQLPKLKLPHIKISGHFSIKPPSAPHFSVEWYKKAYDNPYMFTQPTVVGNMGFGDGPGSEIVYGHQNLMQDIEEAVGKAIGKTGSVLPEINITALVELDGATRARKTYKYSQAESNRHGMSLVTA